MARSRGVAKLGSVDMPVNPAAVIVDIGEKQGLAVRPEGQKKGGGFWGFWLHPQPGEWSACIGAAAGLINHAAKAPLATLFEILPDDRMGEHGHDAIPARGQSRLGPVGGIGAFDPEGAGASDGQGLIHARLSIELVWPDIGAKPENFGRRVDIDRRAIAASAFYDDDVASGRWWALPCWRQQGQPLGTSDIEAA